MSETNWEIHLVQGKELFEGMCDAHTHGLTVYGHLELQFVLAYPSEYIGIILNEIGKRIAKGEKFVNGELVKVSVLSCDLKMLETIDSNGEKIMRIIVPDGLFKWPNESKEYPYYLQEKSPYK